MKYLTLLFSLLTILSCSSEKLEPLTGQQRIQLNQIKKSGIPFLLDQTIESDKKILISTTTFSHEQFALYKYLVPLLHDRKSLDMGFWFLKGNSDEEILKYLKNDDDSLTAKQLLFNADPVLCGYGEYEEFLEYLKAFYSELSDPDLMHITGTENAFAIIQIYGNITDTENQVRFLIHSPLPVENHKWQLPFAGEIYYMMVNDWIMNQYSGIEVKDSILGDQYLTTVDQENHIKAAERTDYLLLMGIPKSYQYFTPIESFVNESNVNEALKSFPNQIIREKLKPANYLINQKISRNYRRSSKRLKSEYMKVIEMFPNTSK